MHCPRRLRYECTHARLRYVRTCARVCVCVCACVREGSVRKIQTQNVKRRERKSRTYSYYKGDPQDHSPWTIVRVYRMMMEIFKSKDDTKKLFRYEMMNAGILY